MRILVLLSAGRHPVSHRPAPVTLELQAIGLARSIARHVIGLHAGPDTGLLRAYGGAGLDVVHRLDAMPSAASLVPVIRALEPDILLAGRRGMGGTDSGMLPYRVAAALGWPIVADVTDIVPMEGLFRFAQFRPHGARRHVSLGGPVVATLHPAAPPPPPIVFARSRAVPVNTVPDDGVRAEASAVSGPLERPYKRRPKMIAPGGRPAARILLTGATPEMAAEAILDHLERLGLTPGLFE